MDCINSEAINVRFRPHLSDMMPHMRPPIATPAKNIISPRLFKFSLSQTKSNSEIIVEPETINKSEFKYSNFLQIFIDDSVQFDKKLSLPIHHLIK